MAIKGGQIIHAGNGVAVIDRIQTAGPGQLNIPTEKIYELGNYNSVATVRDTPDLVFTSESFDVSLEFEALLSGAYTGRTVSDAVTTSADATLTSATAAFVAADVGRQIRIFYNNGTTQVTTILSRTSGVSIELSENATATDTAVEIQIWPNGIDLATAVPVDIASQFKAGVTATSPYAVINSVALPFLYLEQMSYRFGLRDNASQQAQLRGDTIFYNPGPPSSRAPQGPASPRRPSPPPQRLCRSRVRPPSRARRHRWHQAGSPSASTTPRPTARSAAAPRSPRSTSSRRGPDDEHRPAHLLLARPRCPTRRPPPRRHGQAGRGQGPRHRRLHRRLRPRRRRRLAGQQADLGPVGDARLAGDDRQGRGVRQLLRRLPGLRRPLRHRLASTSSPATPPS
jgi:hypothetical protein